MNRTPTFLTLLFAVTCFCGPAYGQFRSTHTVSGVVTDGQNATLLEYARVVAYTAQGDTLATLAGGEGTFRLLVPAGTVKISVDYTGYKPHAAEWKISRDTALVVSLLPSPLTAREVVVTASESRGITSASKINRQAMEHLQPSSFSDLLELIPGGKAKDPNLGVPNMLRLREAASPTGYDLSYMATSFLVDGVPISINADMQAIPGSSMPSYSVRGVDMRSISTDNIESVEIVRGIASAEYGDMLTGLVQIERKAKATPFEGRVKADEYSKLFSAGKGISLAGGRRILNLDMDYLHAKSDVRDPLQTYKRVTASARLTNYRSTSSTYLKWRLNLDYSASIDNQKSDQDVMLDGDRFKSSYQRFNAGANLHWKFFHTSFLRSLDVTSAVTRQLDRMEQVKNIYLSRPTPLPVATVPGESDAELLPYNYVADMLTDGKPFNAFVKSILGMGANTGGVEHTIRAGLEWKYDKNFGRGQVYDLTRPINYTNTNRPRAFRDIPAQNQTAFFVEDVMRFTVGNHRFTLLAGVRGTSELNVTKNYTMHGKIYFDPRINGQWKLPTVGSGYDRWEFELTGGIGWHTKMPTLEQLYPDVNYYDVVQLNYYPSDASKRRVNVRTYIVDPVNDDLRPTRNRKWEVRAGAFHRGMDFSVTYFQESMTNGFRTVAQAFIMPYKNYDNSGIDSETLTGPPALEDIPYTLDTVLSTYSQTVNGSKIKKRGVEFQLSTPRIDPIKTRITVNGAWFRTRYSNSAPQYKMLTANVGGQSNRIVGLYDWEDGSVYQTFNTNFTFDTYIEKLKLTFSTSFQFVWLDTRARLWNDGTPVAYIDKSGRLKPFTEADKSDPYLGALVNSYTATSFQKYKDPSDHMTMNVNFKATKHFGRYARLAMYVNRLFGAAPNIKNYGNLVRRSVGTPYFGMELNLSF